MQLWVKVKRNCIDRSKRQSRRERALAEGVGFEPTEACASRAFQARRFGRSRTPPNRRRVRLHRENDGRLSPNMRLNPCNEMSECQSQRWH